MKPTNEQWKKFAQRIIDKNGNPSLKDAKECEIPEGYFNELCIRGISNEQLIKNAQELISKIERKGE